MPVEFADMAALVWDYATPTPGTIPDWQLITVSFENEASYDYTDLPAFRAFLEAEGFGALEPAREEIKIERPVINRDELTNRYDPNK